MPNGTNTFVLVPKSKIPKNKKVIYGRIVAYLHPNKEELYRVRLTLGGYRTKFHRITATQCSSLMKTKILLNITVSTHGSEFMTLDIKYFYCINVMYDCKYMRITFDYIPCEIFQSVQPCRPSTKSLLYMETRNATSVLNQPEKITNNNLHEHLAPFGYRPVHRTPELCHHES